MLRSEQVAAAIFGYHNAEILREFSDLKSTEREATHRRSETKRIVIKQKRITHSDFHVTIETNT